MSKVSAEAKKKYFEVIKEYRKQVEEILQGEKQVLKGVDKDDPGAAYKKLTLVDENLNVASYQIMMNSLSIALLGVKNENILNESRRSCYKSLIYLEEVFSDFLDVPFSDYESRLERVSTFSENERYKLVRKLGFSIQAVKDGFGENSKWQVGLTEMEGRTAVVAKNCINLKTFFAGLDPRVEGYRERVEHINLTRKLLQAAADSYRKQYEVTTNRIDDFRMAINYLGALRRLSSLLGKAHETEGLKKKIDIWKMKMNSDIKKTEENNRSKRLS